MPSTLPLMSFIEARAEFEVVKIVVFTNSPLLGDDATFNILFFKYPITPSPMCPKIKQLFLTATNKRVDDKSLISQSLTIADLFNSSMIIRKISFLTATPSLLLKYNSKFL